MVILSVVAGGGALAASDSSTVSPEDVSVTSHGVDYYDDIALFEVTNDGGQPVTLTYTNESGTETTVTVDANSATNVTTGVSGGAAGEITLTNGGTTYAHDFAGSPTDLGPENPNPGKITIEAVKYDEENGLIEYKLVNGNDRPVDGRISHVPLNATNNSVTISSDGSTTVVVKNDESRVGDIYRITSALQLDLFEGVDDTMEPGDPVPLLASGEVTDETPRENLESATKTDSDETDDEGSCCGGDDGSSTDSDGEDSSSGTDSGNETAAGDGASGNESADGDDSGNETDADDETTAGDDGSDTGSDDGDEKSDDSSDGSDTSSEDSPSESEGTPGFTAGTALAGGALSLEWLRRRALGEK
ncbi:DNA polymerase V family protein [Natrinema caseinilyticum]|uniref:DNA polymerase V family protein n=1 Tax=Natrinema caseinilyticum TaxID=2961570 RepID=UPI0020C3441E|nr:DNA polymerase V family protein [Natrinema caseinilyticum]